MIADATLGGVTALTVTWRAVDSAVVERAANELVAVALAAWLVIETLAVTLTLALKTSNTTCSELTLNKVATFAL